MAKRLAAGLHLGKLGSDDPQDSRLWPERPPLEAADRKLGAGARRKTSCGPCRRLKMHSNAMGLRLFVPGGTARPGTWRQAVSGSKKADKHPKDV